MFRPKIQKTRVLIIIAVLNISLVYWAANSGNQIESLGYEDKINATKIMEKYIDILKKHAESNTNYHVYDLYKTGLIGAKVTEITTIVDPLPPDKSIMIHSKVACTHPNNFASKYIKKYLTKLDNSLISKPFDYFTICKIISVSDFVITDSGGIQEECATIGVPTVVCRKVTERKEAEIIGIAKISSSNNEDIIELLKWAKNKKIKKWLKRPYGNGNSGKKIAKILLNNF